MSLIFCLLSCEFCGHIVRCLWVNYLDILLSGLPRIFCIFCGTAHSEYSLYCVRHLTVNELNTYWAFHSELYFYCVCHLIVIYFDLLLNASLWVMWTWWNVSFWEAKWLVCVNFVKNILWSPPPRMSKFEQNRDFKICYATESWGIIIWDTLPHSVVESYQGLSEILILFPLT